MHDLFDFDFFFSSATLAHVSLQVDLNRICVIQIGRDEEKIPTVLATLPYSLLICPVHA